MARVVTHTMKQASLNLKDMVDKKPLGLEVDDLTGDVELLTTGTASINGVRTWGIDDKKPEIIETAIEQVKGLFNVGKEVISWNASYYPSSTGSVKGAEVSIPPGEKGLGCRFVIVIGTREVANLSASVGSTEAENSLYMLSGDCINLKITVCPILTITFKNVANEKLAARKGFREMVIKKSFSNRHILVLDGHIEISDAISHVAKKLMGKNAENSSEAVNAVVESASKNE